MKDTTDIDKAMAIVRRELEVAMDRYGPMASAHEGYAVILEELDELWEEVKKNPKRRDVGRMRAEAIQTAAMAIRFIVDVTLPEDADTTPSLPVVSAIA